MSKHIRTINFFMLIYSLFISSFCMRIGLRDHKVGSIIIALIMLAMAYYYHKELSK